jgi:hypothetical protein
MYRTDRAFLVTGELVLMDMLGVTGHAHDATGCVGEHVMQRTDNVQTLGTFSTSTRHMRQLPAMERRSW